MLSSATPTLRGRRAEVGEHGEARERSGGSHGSALVLGVLLFIPFADVFALLLALIWIIVVSLMRSRAPRATRVMAPVSA